MATYWFHYEWRIKGNIAGENSIRFNVPSDDEAREKASNILEEFKRHSPNPDIQYFHVRILKEIRAVKEI